MDYLIIPSAKFAPNDVNNLYHVPMAMFPINGEPILDLIVEHYPNSTKVIVCAYEGYEMFKQNDLADRGIKVLKIDSLRDIGYTVLNALEKLSLTDDDNLIINFADTVIDNNDLTDNCIICHKTRQINKKWTYLSINNGLITEIIDKSTCNETNSEDLLLVCGVFKISKPHALLSFLRNNRTQSGCDFYMALKEYSSVFPFKFIEAQNWLDIGHPDEYFDSKIAIKSRQFNHMSFDSKRGIIKKTSDDNTKLISEISWFLNLPKKLQYVTPRIYDYSLKANEAFVEMEYYSYPTLLELYLYGDLDSESWIKIFNRIGMVLDDFKQFSCSDGDINDALKSMYLDKTISRIEKLKDIESFKPFFEKSIVVNGITYKSLNKLLEEIPTVVSQNLLSVETFNVIHGDLCFANVLIDEKLNFLKLIDPRGSFGNYDIFGDQRYDLAKIFHSIDGKYDFIIKDMFALAVDNNEIKYSIQKPNLDLYELAKDTLKELIGNHLKEIELIESLLFLSMIPLHKESKEHQLAMLSVGLEIMNRWISIEEKENGSK